MLICSCSNDVEPRSDVSESISLRNNSTLMERYNDFIELSGDEDIQELCIGCGCRKAYKGCLEGTNLSCIIPNTEEVDEECCKGQRGECHQCPSGGIICVRIGLFSNGNDVSDYEMKSLVDVINQHGESVFSQDQIEVIDKYMNSEVLTDFDYSLIDEVLEM